MEIETERSICKVCGAPVDPIIRAKCEGHCHECFRKKVEKLVHPF